MQSIISLAALAAYAAGIQLTSEQESDSQRFNEWMNRFNKHYTDGAEHTRRFAIWLAVDQQYQEINANASNTFVVAHNQYSDWSKDEFDSFLMLPFSANGGQVLAQAGQSACACASEIGTCACNDYGVGQADSKFDWR